MKNSNQIFIAEIKIQSPFGYKSEHNFNVLAHNAIAYGDWISVHDNALWGGDFETISFVRKQTQKPILAKGLHSTDDDIKRALDHGADYVLVVDRIPADLTIRQKCLYEWSNVGDWVKFVQDPFNRFLKQVHNIRNLRTGISHKYNALHEYVEFKKVHKEAWICQASNIKTLEDVDPGVDAFIVGTHLHDVCLSLHEEQRRERKSNL